MACGTWPPCVRGCCRREVCLHAWGVARGMWHVWNLARGMWLRAVLCMAQALVRVRVRALVG